MIYSIINIACIHKDLPHTKSKYILNGFGKCVSGIVAAVQQSMELQLHISLQQI